jgi:hypothetical protein
MSPKHILERRQRQYPVRGALLRRKALLLFGINKKTQGLRNATHCRLLDFPKSHEVKSTQRTDPSH